MDILTRIVNSAEDLVHTAVDRHVLPSTANYGVRQRDEDDQSFNPRPRHRNQREQAIPIPCCKCSKWGKCSLKRPAKGCPCVAARRPCTTGCAMGCNCQNRDPWENDTSDEELPPVLPKHTVRTPPRRNAHRTARGITSRPGGGESCLPALPAAPYPPLRPGANTTTPAATSTVGGDDPAAITTQEGESDTDTPATPAEGGGGDETPPLPPMANISHRRAGTGATFRRISKQRRTKGGGQHPPEVNATGHTGDDGEKDARGGRRGR